jgi:hypothetical protein
MASGIVLMCHAVVQSFQNHPFIVCVYLDGYQPIGGYDSLLEIADSAVQVVDRHQIRRAEVLIGPLLTFQLPGDLR